MKCPVCERENLVMSERQGIEIDYCPKCRGVWLDRGELDKIIERSTEGQVVSTQRAAPPPPPQAPQPHPYGHPSMHDSDYGKYKYKKRKSWLKELFD